MSDINKVIILARVGKTPELKHTDGGMAILDLWVANNVYRKDKEDKVNWFTVTVFGKRAESCAKYLEKGSQIAVEGKLDYQQWENKEGQKRNAVKIIADSVQFVGKKKEDSNQPSESQPEPEPVKEPESIPEGESTPVDNQEPLPMPSDEFDSPIDDEDQVPF